MRRNILLNTFILLCLSGLPTWAQSGQWVWLKGDSTVSSTGNYGAIGVPDVANNAPVNIGTGHWTDLQGNFWSMGDNGLWKYDPANNTWTFVHPSGGNGVYGTQGVPAPLNHPGAAVNPICWTDEAGDLWLFGGNHSTFVLDALWRYHIATDEWTWMKGSPGVTAIGNPLPVYGTLHTENTANTPGAKSHSGSCANWVVNNSFWVFGGNASLSFLSLKNDLWRYNRATNNWVWESGEQGQNATGNYGTRGVANAANVPPARLLTACWKDGQQNLYLFSGSTYNSSFNDLWRYNIQTRQWTWLDGNAGPGMNGGSDDVYCIPDSDLRLRSRTAFGVAPFDAGCAHVYWGLGGGRPILAPLQDHLYNDLWLINADKQTWTKVKGHSTGSPVPYHYGTKGVPDPDNLPKARYNPCLWTDKTGNLFLFGGGVPLPGNNTPIPYAVGINDLWKFIPDRSCILAGLDPGSHLQAPPVTRLCTGDSTIMSIPTGVPVSVSPATGTRINTAEGYIVFYGGTTTTYSVVARPDNPCLGYDSIAFTITLPPPPDAAFTINPGTAYLNDAINFVNQSTNAISYKWHENGQLLTTTEDMVHRFTTPGTHCITLVATNKCGEQDSVSHCLEVIGSPVCFVPNAFSPNGDGLNDVFRVEGGNFKLLMFDIYNRYGQRIFNTNTPARGWDGTFNGERCDIGTYYYYIRYTDQGTGAAHTLKGDVALLP